MYKLTKPDGTDFYSGKINYADNVGKIIRVAHCDPPEAGDCGRGLHSCKNPNNCFVGAKIPCRAFKVETIDVIVRGKQKTRSQALKIITEVTDLNKLFGWKYEEVINPINPFKLAAPLVSEEHLLLLKQWDSVGASVWASVWASVGTSVRDSVGASVRASVRASVGASVRAYVGSLFPNINKWKCIKHKKGVYPFQTGADLWRMGFVPTFNGKIWRLHAGERAAVVWEGTVDAI